MNHWQSVGKIYMLYLQSLEVKFYYMIRGQNEWSTVSGSIGVTSRSLQWYFHCTLLT